MSRIGKLPISVPDKVTLTIANGVVSVKGPKGELAQPIPSGVKLNLTNNVLVVERAEESNESRSAHGLARTLINNMVVGVTTGFTRTLIITGVGYKAEMKGKRYILLSLGYSHPILYELPPGIEGSVDSKAKDPVVTITGSDKQLLGATAAKIRGLRAPEPYKGKGVRYSDETIRRKEGKTGGKKK